MTSRPRRVLFTKADRTLETRNKRGSKDRDEMIRVQMDEEDYRLVGPGDEEGALVEYGQPAAVLVGEAVYYAVAGGQTDQPTVFCVDSVSPAESVAEEVAFDYPDEEEEEEEGEGAEEGEEEEEDEEEEDDDDDDLDPVIIAETGAESETEEEPA